jgi:putative DNA primase/helicase
VCKVTPKEVFEAMFAAWDIEDAAEEAAKKAAAPTEPEKAKPKPPVAPAGRPRSTGSRPEPVGDNRVERCQGYIKTVAPSIEGQEGSKRVFHVARLIWNDFGIDEADGYPLLEEYNLSALPPWEEDGKQGLRRKWNEAVAKGPGPEGRGFMLERDRPDWKQPARASSPRSRPKPSDSIPDGNRDGNAPPASSAGGDSGLPEIIFNNRQYRDVEADALAALVLANDPPRLFVGNGCGLVDLQRGNPELPLAARELDGPAMRTIFGRVADWMREEDGDLVADFPPSALLSSFPARGEWPNVPHLRSVVTYPVFGPGWVLNATPGYHPSSGLYLDLGDLVVPDVAERPDAEDVRDAVDLIVNELLGDFPFVAPEEGKPSEERKPNAHLANAVAMLILPVVRHAIDGPTPLAMIDAPTEGTGKSLLAEVATLATVGEEPEAISPDMKEEEWNKFLLAELITGRPVIYFDNGNRKLDNGALASALTAKWKRGRLLGETKIASARVNVCWLFAANNVECSREIARRSIWTRIDRGVENPSAEPVKYRHPDLIGWVRENRPRIIAAIITLVNNWIAKGVPPGTATLGKFEAWANAIGGILAASGIDGLLGNADEFRGLCANQANEMPEFVRLWWEQHRGAPVIAADLFTAAKESLESVLTAENDDGRRKQLGKFLKKQRDRVFGGYQILLATKDDGVTENRDYAGRPRYRLKELKARKTADPPKPTEYSEEDEGFDLKG